MRGSNGGEITRTFRCILSKVVVAQYINDNEFELKRITFSSSELSPPQSTKEASAEK